MVMEFFTLVCQSKIKWSVCFFKGWWCQCYLLKMLLGHNAKYHIKNQKILSPSSGCFQTSRYSVSCRQNIQMTLPQTHRHFTEPYRLCPNIWDGRARCSLLLSQPQEMGCAKCVALLTLTCKLAWVFAEMSCDCNSSL